METLLNPSLAPFTLFAPTDDAFNPQLTTFFVTLFLSANRQRLENFVNFHMITGAMVMILLYLICNIIDFHVFLVITK